MKTEAELSFNRQLDLWDLWDLRLCSSTYGSESVKLDVEDCTLIPARSLSITFRLFGIFFQWNKKIDILDSFCEHTKCGDFKRT